VAESGNTTKIYAGAGLQPDMGEGWLSAGAGTEFQHSPTQWTVPLTGTAWITNQSLQYTKYTVYHSRSCRLLKTVKNTFRNFNIHRLR